MAGVTVRGLVRRYADHVALDDVSIDFPDGGFYGLLGPSGSGKTTLLRLIAGFDAPDRGRIAIGGEDVGRVPVERRRIGMVFQSYAIFPNMDVAANVAFGLSVRGVARADIRRRVAEALALVRLEDLAGRRAHELSGGQRQRVALARAIVTEPCVLLLDEPLGALDRALRAGMQVELRRIQRDTGITTIFVTHDQEEALGLSDRVGVLRDGRLVQEGTPESLYDRPASEFVATFLGDANLLRGTVEGDGVRLDDGTRVRTDAPLPARGARVTCVVRPERLRLAPLEPPGRPHAPPTEGDNRIEARVAERTFTGSAIAWTLTWSGGTLRASAPNDGRAAPGIGEAVEARWRRAATGVLPAC